MPRRQEHGGGSPLGQTQSGARHLARRGQVTRDPLFPSRLAAGRSAPTRPSLVARHAAVACDSVRFAPARPPHVLRRTCACFFVKEA